MEREIVFIVYVSDIDRAVEFYRDVLELQTDFVTPRYVTFSLGEGVAFALWTGYSGALDGDSARTSEVCMNVPEDQVMKTYEAWQQKGVTVAEEPHEDVFGTTFVAADPDGNRIRVAPID
ncbi:MULTISPECIES: VOC family protein [unclassified Corynebacterium]|uniref:VOC family protein n=1 Tax=unclassified Corynebacterium TaxID=2624378 RepID=UPI0021A995BF|nr:MULTISPECIES: VOC family protein [unclassified Corynebacterium]MCT1452446.1 VOC family protein [Corynebacterium sp. p3-SID1145]MCT1461348.1 VOC family protein [Corynebacterium sp. p3-SID1140]MDN8595551.1 VOC family protein [Corynebacterium sp. P4_F2]WKK56303.1 VOC family protein [Corynebacterium sp. P4-C1]WKK63715.1 VOC family protein [Corynebacterium sp. P8-C1]